MGEPGWGEVVWSFVEHFGWSLTLPALGVLAFLWRIDLLKWIVSTRGSNRLTEREQNWDDAQDIIKLLREELARVRTAREEEAAELTQRLAEKDDQIRSLIKSIESSERGNSRLRHALNNVCQIDAGIRTRARAAGLDVPPFPLGTLMELDDEWGERLKAFMRESC